MANNKTNPKLLATVCSIVDVPSLPHNYKSKANKASVVVLGAAYPASLCFCPGTYLSRNCLDE